MKKIFETIFVFGLLVISLFPANIYIIKADDPLTATFGNTVEGTNLVNFENRILGTWGEAISGNGTADSINIYVKAIGGDYTGKVTAGLYTYIDNETDFAGDLLLNGQTEEKEITVLNEESKWIQLNFNDPKPNIENNTKYYCVASAELINGYLRCHAIDGQPSYSFYKISNYNPELPSSLSGEIGSSYHRSIYCSYTITQQNAPPVITEEEPSNGAIEINRWPSCQVTILDIDEEEEEMTVQFYENTTGSWVLQQTNTGVLSGDSVIWSNYSNASEFSTKYWWKVCCFDGTYWTNDTYYFTTRPGNYPPIVSDELPIDGSTGISFNPTLSVFVEDIDADELTVIFKSNASGSWDTLGTYNGGDGSYVQSTTDMINSDTVYYWSVHVTDSNSWTNNTYYFTTVDSIMPTLKWYETTSTGVTSTGPLVADVNVDGRMDVIRSGENGIIVLDGETGATVWTKPMTMWNDHCPLEIIDLDLDGIPEIIFSYGTGTMAIHGDDGSEYWYNPNAPLHNKHSVAGDIDADGYPEVFVTTSIGGSITAMTHDGQIFAQTYTYYPCFSGLSLGDTDQDGVFELYLNERSADYHDNGLGKGVRAMWASNLTDRWYREDILCSSHCPTLVDVDKDGKLDVVSLQQNGGGIIVLNSTDGSVIHYTKNIPGLGCHSQPTIHDIDNDGNLELIACRNSKPIVWDLYDWTPESGGVLDEYGRLPYVCNEPPGVADIDGDGNVEIIACTLTNISIFNNNYEFVGSFLSGGTQGQPFFMAQDVDNDSLNELVFNRGASVYVFDILASSPTPRALSQIQFYSQHRERSPYFTQYGPLAPVARDEDPINEALNYPSDPVLSVYIHDYQQDLMNITFRTNASGSWQDITTYTNASNGRYSTPTTNMNLIDTTYWWGANLTDINGHSRNMLYKFTTTITKPILLNPYPNHMDDDKELSPILSIDAVCYQGPTMDIMFRTNASGDWETIGFNSSVINGTFTCDNTDLMSTYFTNYWWSINSTDLGTGNWTNTTYKFMTEFNDPPVITTVTPTLDEVDVSVYLTELKFDLSDDESDIMDYTVETVPDIGGIIGTSNGGGRITINVSNLNYLTTYIVFINATDPFGPGNHTNEIYQFTTEATSVDPIIPYEHISSPISITASGISELDNVSLYYRWSETNWSDDWTTLTYDNFEGDEFDWGNWSDGGADCKQYTDEEFAHDGTNAINLEDYTSTSYTEPTIGLDLDTSGYTQLKIDFWAYYTSIEDDEYLEVYFDRNSIWKYYPVYENQFIHHTILVSEADYTFDTDVKIRFEAEFSAGNDDAYIDQIYINATTTMDWTSWNNAANPDTTHPWNWNFDFPQNTGYYQFSSVGNKSGMPNETIPDYSDAICHYTDNSPYILDPNPMNNEVDLPLDLSDLSFTLVDYQNDQMDYTITTIPDIINGPLSDNDVVNETTISIPINDDSIDYDMSYIWYVNVTDGTFWTNESFTFTTRPAPASWWDENWRYRKEIQIDHKKVAGDLVSFPVLLRHNNDDNLAAHAKINGEDILFTDNNGDKLDHEIEFYNSDSGNLTVWVNVPSLSSTSNTILYMYYGNPSASDQQNPEGVWDSDYLAVHHFSETSGNHQDSTSNQNDSTVVTVADQGASEGIINKCDVLDGTDNFIQFPNKKFAAGKDELTIEIWINPDNDIYDTMIYDEWNGANYWQHTFGYNGYYTRDASGGPSESRDNDISSTHPPELNNWQYLSMWYSVSEGEKRIYYNGSINAYTLTNVGNLTNDRNEISPRLGYASDGTNFSGKFDEFRVSKVARSTEWLKTTYNTISSSNTFLTVGTEELLGMNIINIKAQPPIQIVDGFVNISCNVIGSEGIDTVKVDITYPDLSSHNETMIGSYYYNAPYSEIGTYNYYIWANDTNGDSSTSAIYSFEIVEQIPMINYMISLSEGWNLISLPVNESVHKENLTVNYLGENSSWNQAVYNDTILSFIFGWNESIQNYEIIDILNPGEGYWLYANDDCDLWISSNITSSNDYITNLLIGWNLIGLPYDTSLAKENLTIFYDGFEYTWNEAVNDSIILPFIYGWNTNIQNYDFTENLNPGMGYWLYANYDCILLRSII